MGWTEYHTYEIYNPKTGRYIVDRKTECDKLFNCDMVKGLGKFEVLKSRMVGSTYYAAVKRTTFATETKPEEVIVFAAIVLTAVNSKSYYNFAYKDMDETVGPYKYDCPKSILDLLTPTESEWANEWRKQCYERLKNKNNPNGLNKLPLGTAIKVTMPFDTKFYNKGDTVTLTKCNLFGSNRTGWYASRARFTNSLMKSLEEHYEIVKKGE
jgi:hypothetical protein